MDRKLRREHWRQAFTKKALRTGSAPSYSSSSSTSPCVQEKTSDQRRHAHRQRCHRGRIQRLHPRQRWSSPWSRSTEPREGGIVQIITEEGSNVKAGDPILLLSNDNLDLQISTPRRNPPKGEHAAEHDDSMSSRNSPDEQNRIRFETTPSATSARSSRTSNCNEERLISREDYLKAQEDGELSQRNRI